jgi:hypothetical protein
MTTNVRARIHAVLGPGIVRAHSSREALCESRAAQMYGSAVDKSGGNRAAARLGEVDERTIRDRRSTARGIALKDALLTLDRDGLYELANLLCDYADEQGPRSDRTGTNG